MSLLSNSFLYEACLNWADLRSQAPDRCLEAIASTARLAWIHHPGRFADGALENYALRLGRSQLPSESPLDVALRWGAKRPSKTLHVATSVHPVGGHTRVLAKWVLGDVSANHAVVLTEQKDPVPEFLQLAISQSGGNLVCLPLDRPAAARALMLRALGKYVDRIVLHTHPDDPVPVVAFAAEGGPPVAMFNHAHFSFCLGATVSDVVVNTLGYFMQVSERHRFARRTLLLSGVSGLVPLNLDPIDKSTAKAGIGIHHTATVLLTMAHEQYFRPLGDYDFFRTARGLLSRNPTAHLVVVGIGAKSALVPADLKREPRCHLMGTIPDPRRYYQAADVFLESFPMPSFGSLLESVTYGEAFPVPVYGATESVLRVSLAPALTYLYRPVDEPDYISYVSQLLADLATTREQARQARVELVAFDGRWATDLAELNLSIDKLRHEPGDIPKAAMVDSPDTRALADLEPLHVRSEVDRTAHFWRGLPKADALARRLANWPASV